MTWLGKAPTAERRATRALSVTGVALLVIVLAACGSQLDPSTVARVNGTGTGAQAGQAPGTVAGTAPDGSVPDGSGLSGTGSDPGSGTDPGTTTDAGPGTGTGPSGG